MISSDTIHDTLHFDKRDFFDSKFGTFIHDVFCTYSPERPSNETLDWLKHILSAEGYSGIVKADWMLQMLESFYAFLDTTYVEYALHKELPIQAVTDTGQYIDGYVDLVVEVGDTLLIIDYKTFVAKVYTEELYADKVLQYKGQLAYMLSY